MFEQNDYDQGDHLKTSSVEFTSTFLPHRLDFLAS